MTTYDKTQLEVQWRYRQSGRHSNVFWVWTKKQTFELNVFWVWTKKQTFKLNNTERYIEMEAI